MRDEFILHTDELDNSIDYLEKAAFYYKNRKDKYCFKWLMISLHGALYGFGVCAVKGITIERVLEMKLGKAKFEKKKKETVKYYEQMGFVVENESILDQVVDYNASQLLSIWDILDYCQDEGIMTQRLDSKVLKMTDMQNQAIKKMIHYRNEFAHFKPKALGITKSEQWIIKEIINVIKFLALESGNVFYKGSHNKEDVEKLICEFNT
ncbi:hypothetical protein [Metabacillus sp. FJAT-53654]|uniref:RiboL-PSP-HEPN domain-containing protein n=1 Tax=Metabacillus rhizosphaerae TaxID=3117747 RepID=A0ABZ2MZV5_9BACI